MPPANLPTEDHRVRYPKGHPCFCATLPSADREILSSPLPRQTPYTPDYYVSGCRCRLLPSSPAGQTRTSPFRGFRMRSQDPSQKIRYLARFHQGQSPDAGLDADRRVLYPLEIRAAHRRHADRKFPFPSFHRILVTFSRSLIKFALRFRGGLFFDLPYVPGVEGVC